MIILCCILGSITGIIAGLIPGIHSNNLTIILLATPFFGIEITAFVLSMCMTQSFVEFIPSTFMGVPSENTFESILPAHKLLIEGRAVEAITHTVFGGIIAVIIGTLLTIPFFLFLDQTADQIKLITPFVLVFAIILFLHEGKTTFKKIIILFIIIASGAQGLFFKNQVFPLITGYFGIAGIITSMGENKPSKIEQTNECTIKNETLIDGLIGVIGGSIVSIMPGIGSNTAGGIINVFRKSTGTRNYLAMLGAINTSNFFFSLVMLIALGKSRNGAMIALTDKIFYTQETLLIGTLIMLFSAGVGGVATIILAKKAVNLITLKKIKFLNIGCIIIMVLSVLLFNGMLGLTALFFSTALGIFTIKQNVRRSTLMSSLIIPTIFFYLFILI